MAKAVRLLFFRDSLKRKTGVFYSSETRFSQRFRQIPSLSAKNAICAKQGILRVYTGENLLKTGSNLKKTGVEIHLSGKKRRRKDWPSAASE